ncbi:MAG TPA: hypothetical protein DC049_15290 [Spirochaetia bacterium]|nr:hypothetical protein [Spirochaetia bacterium]
MKFFGQFPDPDKLLAMAHPGKIYPVNSHIHTPCSFSAFGSIKEIIEQAAMEKIGIAGLNDFYSTAGFDEFRKTAFSAGIFPHLGLEFITMQDKEKETGTRVNDPNNPGRTYFGAKGFFGYSSINPAGRKLLDSIIEANRRRACAMAEKLAGLIALRVPQINFSEKNVLVEAGGVVQERHVARAIRKAVYAAAAKEERHALLEALYQAPQTADLENETQSENEIRSKLLKNGCAAYVEEDNESFLPLEDVIELIGFSGAIPCYPVLLDDSRGFITEYEKNTDELAERLKALKIPAVELIPRRNTYKAMKAFAANMFARGFLVLFGTEHNTPEKFPLTVLGADQPLDSDLLEISYHSACAVTAHMYLMETSGKKYEFTGCFPDPQTRSYYIKLGSGIHEFFFRNYSRFRPGEVKRAC